MHLLYQIEISKADCQSAYQSYLKSYPQKQEIADFSLMLFEGVSKNLQELDSLIKKYVKNWEIDRMAIIDRNILRIACFEMIFIEEIPPKVSINEAIELAKRFGDIDSPRFVNGVLDKIYKMESKKDSENTEKDESCKT